MPSHKNDGIRMLTERGPMHPVLWHNLIEARRALIKPYLDTFTLPDLGSLRCLKNEADSPDPSLHTLAADNPIIGLTGEPFSLKTQGIFRQAQPKIAKFPDNIKRIWGLARSGEWLLAEVEIEKDIVNNVNYERALRVKIYEQTLEVIMFGLGVSYTDMWYELNESVRGWLRLRKKMYEDILEISRIIETEELLLSLR